MTVNSCFFAPCLLKTGQLVYYYRLASFYNCITGKKIEKNVRDNVVFVTFVAYIE